VKKLKKIALALSILMISQSFTVFAKTESDLQTKIEENKSSIEALKDKKEEINGEIEAQYSELESIVSEIESKSQELNKAKQEVEYYENLISEVQIEIDNINNQIDSLNKEIEIREAVIKEKEAEAEKTRQLLDNRIRSYYKIDMTVEIVFMILESESLTGFMQNLENAYKIIKLDRELIEALNKVQEEMNNEKLAIQEELIVIEDNKKSVVEKQQELVLAQDELLVKQQNEQSKMDELLALENNKNQVINTLSAEEAQVANEIGDLLTYNQELQQELDNLFQELNNNNQNQSNNISSDGEGFLRPGVGEVTDSYGGRINPVTFAPGFHTGVDFADAYGSNVYASKSGTVIYSGWISGYGNTVIINHGNGVETLYAHNSELLVSVGQEVSRGEVVALVGSTGMSTGPHIHFEIRINGSHVNPMDYL